MKFAAYRFGVLALGEDDGEPPVQPVLVLDQLKRHGRVTVAHSRRLLHAPAERKVALSVRGARVRRHHRRLATTFAQTTQHMTKNKTCTRATRRDLAPSSRQPTRRADETVVAGGDALASAKAVEPLEALGAVRHARRHHHQRKPKQQQQQTSRLVHSRFTILLVADACQRCQPSLSTSTRLLDAGYTTQRAHTQPECGQR